LKDYFKESRGCINRRTKQMNGLPSRASLIKGFVTHFTIISEMKVIRDERFTSKMAFQSMIDNGMKKSNAKIRH
jgi:putative Holliday junction resolvase